MEENKIIAQMFYQRFMDEINILHESSEDNKEILKYGLQWIDERAYEEEIKPAYKNLWIGFCVGVSVGMEIAMDGDSLEEIELRKEEIKNGK